MVRAQPSLASGRSDTPSIWPTIARAIAVVSFVLIGLVAVIAVLAATSDEPGLAGTVLTLTIPAFLAGVLSMLSPCSLPILLGYFSLALAQRQQRIDVVTFAFLGGLATTMTVLGASFTALGATVIEYQPVFTLVGGILIVLFGIMSFFGRGFSGIKFANRPSATAGGAYVYGAIFALGWTACVGPILGSILTLLLAQGSSVGGMMSLVGGGVLALIYVTGLGFPLLLLVAALQSGGPNARLARALRGRGWKVPLAGRTLYLHSTSVMSGLMLVGLGLLLATGQMTAISQRLVTGSLAEKGVAIEEAVYRLFQ